MIFLKFIRLLFSPKKETYFALKRILGFFPDNILLYEEALLHKSSARGIIIQGCYKNNERLEFLGDAVLNTIVADIVFKKFKNQNEGFLTNTRSKIVKRETMDKISCELGLNKLIVSSPIRSQKNHISGNALEAFIGAIYLDRGYRKTYRFVNEKIIKRFININALARKEVNFKSKLLEWSQANRTGILFKSVENFKDNNKHNPVFQSQVFLNGLMAGVGTGYSKKESHQQAAQMALKRIKTDKDFAIRVMEGEKVNDEQ